MDSEKHIFLPLITSSCKVVTEVKKTMRSNNFHSDLYEKYLASKIDLGTEGHIYRPVIIRGRNDLYRNEPVFVEAKHYGYTTPPAELALLLYDMLLKQKIVWQGIERLIIMHTPITDNCNIGCFIAIVCKKQEYKLDFPYAIGGKGWHSGNGFVFLAPTNRV